MNSPQPPPVIGPEDEISALIATLHEAERRLVELTGGEVDTVSSGAGRPFLLRHAQEELRSSEAVMQAAILNALPAHIALLDAEGVVVAVNEAWRQFATANLLQGPDFGVGVNYLEVCAGARGEGSAEASRAADGIRAVLAGAKNYILEYPCHSPREQRWFVMTVTPLTEARAHGIVVMHLDVTERKLAEAALAEMTQATLQRERMLTTTLSSLNDFAYIFDRAGRFLFANEPLLRLWGFPLESVVGRNFLELGYPAELAARLQQQVQDVFTEKRSIIGETPYTSATGAEGVYEYIFSPALAADGRVDFVVGSTRDVTERKRSEEASRTNEREQRQLAERLEIETARFMEAQIVAKVGSWETDLATLNVTWSEETFRIFETDAEQFKPTHAGFMALVHPDDRALVDSAFLESLKHTAPYAIEHRLLLPGGRIKFVEERWRAHVDAQGKPLRVFGTCHDITERKWAEEALRTAEAKYHSIFENSVEGIFQTTPDGRFISANPAMARILGFASPEELIRERTDVGQQGYAEPARREEFKRLILEQGSVTGFEYELRRKEGAHIWVSENTRIVRDAAGHAAYYEGTLRDITDRKHAEEALRASERRFKALFDQAAVGVAQSNVITERFLHVNQRFADIVGRSREEMEQLTFTGITHPADVGRDREMVEALRAGSIREYSREKRYLRKDGSEVWVSVTVSAMWAPGERPGLSIAIVQDITERKRLDEHFLQAQKMEALGQFSGGVAHDFNNILATISGYTELSRMILKDNPEVREHLDSVLKASGRAADLVRQILTFSRQQPQERHAIQLRPVVEESIKLLRATIPTTITFDTAIAADAPTVLANANQINQVLMNLGINAWHAMKDAPGRLHIVLENWLVDEAQATAQPRLRPGQYARVSIQDTGSGMDPATLRRIFEPFFTTKPVGEGTGLGLAVVHGIMDGHDGAITVESQPGEGTVFHLYFPAHAGMVAVSALAESPTPHGKGEAVLVVDDEDMIASMIQQTLIRLDYAVEFTTDPAAALALVQAAPQRFKLVLSDQSMPSMTGLTLAARLRELCPELPVILMTGYSASLTSDRIQAAGVRQVLLKPLTVHELGSAVHAVFSPPVIR